MPGWTTELLVWLPESMRPAAAVIAFVLMVGVWATHIFRRGQGQGDTIKNTVESSMRSELASMAAEGRNMHRETHERLERLERNQAVLLDRR